MAAAPVTIPPQWQWLGPPQYFFFFSVFLLLVLIGCIILFILLARRTHGWKELAASLRGRPLILFFDDNRTVTWKNIKPEAGIIRDDDFGDYIVNEKGTYIDKSTRNILIPFSTNLAIGAEVKHFKMAEDLNQILGNEKELQKIAQALAAGQFDDERFDVLKTSVNFSHLKSLANTIIPHNITAKINMEVAKRLKTFGNINGKQMVIWIIIIIGSIGLMALVLYLTIHGKSGGTTNIYTTAEGAKNLTNTLIG